MEQEAPINKFVIRGTRGSIPACGRRFLKYGGNTTCFSLETEQGIIIIDAGTGIGSVGRELSARSKLPPLTLLFTHLHLDHVVGLPSFGPLYDPRAWITLFGDSSREDDWRSSLRTLIGAPYWPTDLGSAGASKSLECLPIDTDSMDVFGVRVSWCPVSHPQQCLSYKLSMNSTTIVVATDHEHTRSDLGAGFLDFCRGADFLLYDAMYTPDEYSSRVGWGHGSWQQGVQLAIEANIRELVLTHHDSGRTDAEIDEIVGKAREYFPNTRAAAENSVLALP